MGVVMSRSSTPFTDVLSWLTDEVSFERNFDVLVLQWVLLFATKGDMSRFAPN